MEKTFQDILNIHKFPTDTLSFKDLKKIVLSLYGLSFSEKYIVIIAGTNGKGTTASLIKHYLLSENIKTAMNSSPHLINFNERININGKNISNDDLLKSYLYLKDKFTIEFHLLSYYHLAFLLFCESVQRNINNIDAIIFEVGIGGRIDPANIFDSDFAILTNVGLDHVSMLGNTREKIFSEKIKIQREDKPLLIGDKNLSKEIKEIIEKSKSIVSFSKKHLIDNLNNLHKESINTAMSAINILKKQFKINRKIDDKVFTNFNLYGRCQLLKKSNKNIILDVAHNAEALSNLKKTLTKLKLKNYKITAIFSAMKSKPVVEIIETMDYLIDKWFFIDMSNENKNCMSKSDFKQLEKPQTLNNIRDNSNIYNDIIFSKFSINSSEDKNHYYIVFGGFSIVGEVLKSYQEYHLY